MTETYKIGSPKVLILAYPELARAICEALKKLLELDCQGTTEENEKKQYTVHWLCSQVFPCSAPSGCLSILPMFPSSENLSHSSMSLFQWGDYDFVIIQDLWLMSDDSQESLVAAGYVFASMDYYDRGNFGTKKVVLITDPDFVHQKVKNDYTSWEGFCNTFDEKGAMAVVSVTFSDTVKCLKDIITNRRQKVKCLKDIFQQIPHHETSNNNPTARNRAIARVQELLQQPVMEAAAEHLRKYIYEQAEVIMVDDEVEELRKIFRGVTGNELSNYFPTQAVNLAVASQGPDQKLIKPNEFETLAGACKEKFLKAIANGKKYVIFVTDILFNLPNWDKTGIDLIEELRKQFRHHVGIVAFTGFSTPFITMSAYQRGADFVVQKGDTYEQGHGAITTFGTYRLLMTLAFLCFQKQFLNQKRLDHQPKKMQRETQSQQFRAVESNSFFTLADNALRQLKCVLPLHAVSMHIQPEWLDTYYFLEAVKIYRSDSNQIKLIWKNVNDKYGTK